MAHSSGETHRSSSDKSVLQNALCHSLSVLSPKMRTCADPLSDILRQSRGATAGHVPSHLEPPRCASSKKSDSSPESRLCCATVAASAPTHRNRPTAAVRAYRRMRWRLNSTGVTSSRGFTSASRRGVASLALEAMTPRDRTRRGCAGKTDPGAARESRASEVAQVGGCGRTSSPPLDSKKSFLFDNAKR